MEYRFRNYDNNKTIIENLLSYRNIPKEFRKEKLYGIKDAINRIKLAIDNKEKIGIFSDADCDGINGCVILMKNMMPISKCIHYIVCDRENGYGIINKYYDEMHRLGVSLIITTDIGISNKDEIEYGKSLGIDTIVTDHHPIVNPPDCIYINPEDWRNDDVSKYCGAGVSYILMKNLYEELGVEFDKHKTSLCHAGIATVGDMVSLSDNNYLIVKETLEEFENLIYKSKPLQWIVKNGLSYVKNRNYVSSDISFGIAPMINSLHRMSHPTKAVEFFLSNDKDFIETIGNYIKENNISRKNKQKKSIIEALSILDKKNKDENIIFLDLDISKTFAGLVASFITSDYLHKPSIVVSKDKNNIYYGSGRSIKSCSLSPLLELIKPYCIKVGGHPSACGISFHEDNKEKIINIIKEFGKEQFELGNLNDIVYIDKELKITEIDNEFIKDIGTLEPYGMSNPNPIFYSENMQISKIECNNFNTYFKLEEIGNTFNFFDNIVLDAVFFKRDYSSQLNCGDIINIIYELTSDGTLLIKNLEIVE